ncbi:MAG: serine/threonine-protein kinase [Pseudomonadota bacterium]
MTDLPVPPPQVSEAPANHLDALPAGARLAEFEIQSLLGVGGFGMVYRAYDHSLHRTVAIKEYMPSSLVSRADNLTVSPRSSKDQASYALGLKSFIAEARLLAQFDHPSLVKVHRFWEANNTAYMAMPLYSGMTLKQARKLMRSPPPEDWLRKILWPILQALDLLHENNIVHRDVSPDNIFLQDSGAPVLLDLGSARRAITDASHRHTAILKANYAPIEQYADASYQDDDMQQGPWTDLYSLAAVVYSSLSNQAPTPSMFRVARDRMPTFSSIVTSVAAHFGLAYSTGFVNTIHHALAVQPSARPQRVAGFIHEMSLNKPEDMSKFDWRIGLGELLQTPYLAQAIVLPTPLKTVPSDPINQAVQNDANEQTVDQAQLLLNKSPVNASEYAAVPGKSKVLLTSVLALSIGLMGVAGIAMWLAQTAPVAPIETRLPIAIKQTSKKLNVNKSDDMPNVIATPAPAGESIPATSTRVAAPAVPTTRPAAPKIASTKANINATTSSASVNCSDTNFLSRPACIQRECKKPGLTNHPLCVEARRKQEENEVRNKSQYWKHN